MTNNEKKLLVILEEFQDAERRYSEAVNDLVKAEIRRDVAKREKDECYARLEKARAKYSDGLSEDPPKYGKATKGKAELAPDRRKSAGVDSEVRKNKQNAKTSSGVEAKPIKTKPSSSKNNLVSTEKSNKAKGMPGNESSAKQSSTQKNQKSSMTKQRDGVSPQRKSFKKLVAIEPLSAPVDILGICKGRTREWLDKHLDCDSFGLVRNFYKASFGTRTNPETQKLAVSTILISDEWNELVQTTADVQELYIGTGNSSSGISTAKYQTNLRDKVAEVLAAPQTESIALFYAPKKKFSHLYYGGHWKVKRGKILDPPKMVMGQLRQCYLKLVFVGVNQALVDAINGNSSK